LFKFDIRVLAEFVTLKIFKFWICCLRKI